jgi:hypothetical protein
MNTQDTEKSVSLPWFPGFYNSILDHWMDSEIEQEAEAAGKDTGEMMDSYDAHEAMAQMTAAWVEQFAKTTGIRLRFEELNSPREYNFTTDRAFALVPLSEVHRIEPARHTEHFAKVLREWFKSGDGFISFYDSEPDGECWQKPVEEWDHNQLSALVAAYVLQSMTPEEIDESVSMAPEVYERAQDGWKAEAAQ